MIEVKCVRGMCIESMKEDQPLGKEVEGMWGDFCPALSHLYKLSSHQAKLSDCRVRSA